MRIGIGYDSHRMIAGRPLVIGGVHVAHELGLEGHSDADVLAHAVIDALLGAAGLGDIGEHFPDTEEAWRGADYGRALELLERLGVRELCVFERRERRLQALSAIPAPGAAAGPLTPSVGQRGDPRGGG